MIVLAIVFGVLLCIAAALTLIGTFAEESVILLGLALVLGAGGGFLVWHGVHSLHSREHRKHDQILTDLRAQGYQVAYNQVFISGSYLEVTTEVDLSVGSCVYPFLVGKVQGVWHVELPTANGRRVLLSPADLAPASACR